MKKIIIIVVHERSHICNNLAKKEVINGCNKWHKYTLVLFVPKLPTFPFCTSKKSNGNKLLLYMYNREKVVYIIYVLDSHWFYWSMGSKMTFYLISSRFWMILLLLHMIIKGIYLLFFVILERMRKKEEGNDET